MARYVARRLAMAAVTVLVILCVLFLLLQFMPGSPFNNEKLTDAQLAVLYQKYGLDRPFYEQFLIYLGNMLRGDFGESYAIQPGMGVAQLVGSRLPLTLQIGLQAAILGSFLGLVLGVVAALRHGTAVDSAATFVSVLGVSLPSFVFALILQYFLAYRLKLFPITFSDSRYALSTVLPTIALSMFTLANIERYSRNELIEVLDSDYILLADCKGLSKAQVVMRHALRNSLVGVVTILAPLVVNLLVGSLVVEQAFSIPGIGSLFVKAIQMNDFNVVIGLSFVYSLLFIGAMLVVDVLYGVIDPRITLAKGGLQ